VGIGPLPDRASNMGREGFTADLGPGQLVRLDEPLDAFIGANTIEITVTGSPSALPRLSGWLDKDWTPPTP
jgi:hypothetical protein